MLKRFLSVSIVVLLLNMVGVIPAYAKSQGDAQVRSQKVKEAIVKLGTGEAAKVELTLRDGRKLKGYVREADQDAFVVVDPKTGAATTVAYSEVKEIKRSKLPSGARIGLGVAAAVGIGIALSIVLVAVIFHGDK
jgi:NMD protein affecting ribosome stability and mRNA decay